MICFKFLILQFILKSLLIYNIMDFLSFFKNTPGTLNLSVFIILTII